MDTIITFQGRQPSAGEYEKVIAIPFTQTEKSAVEKSAITRKVLYYLGAAAGMFILGFLLLSAYPIIGGTIIFGGIIVLIGAIATFFSRNTKPKNNTFQKTLNEFVGRVVLGNDVGNFPKRSIEYAYAVLQRLMPQELLPQYSEFEPYLKGVRSVIQTALDNDAKNMNLDLKGDYGRSQCGFRLISSSPVSTNIVAVQCEYYLYYEQYNPSIQKNITYSAIKMNFNVIMVQSETRWFIYDVMPEYTVEQQKLVLQNITLTDIGVY